MTPQEMMSHPDIRREILRTFWQAWGLGMICGAALGIAGGLSFGLLMFVP